ncbi:MAG: DEAD/DEAH box helicase [Nanoarchaeota archaeon]|nr:DEAD/DEAH box helicase [Nanoarchaeota archaeon]MBU4300258.1 DEAD/DEAH box helicase [Nanoarchaeota archaeon]MBU4452528.1 DEAD/DEAH box helicase [Nanoarchaeota archaeon]MCG2723233.1 DEAD/DEAH box helicase [archaeon]
MNVSELTQLPENARNTLISEGITILNPPQELAVNAGLLDGKNMIVFAPTASGKTFVAELAMLNIILNLRKKAVYIVPLKALGSEKYEEFKARYAPLGIKVGVSMGDYDSEDLWLSSQDLIIVTSEKLDSLMRHYIPWIHDVGLVVVDEIHLLNDISRGPTLEITITRMRDTISRKANARENAAIGQKTNALQTAISGQKTLFQMLGLSATISNAEELAGWLGAELVQSDYRPIPLKKGVYFGGCISYGSENEQVNQKHDDDVSDMIEHALAKDRQVLVFVNSRKSAEAQAEKLGDVAKKYADISISKTMARDAIGALSTPTKQCKRLGLCLAQGTAFHHAGLVPKQRKLIEDSFKSKSLKVICATPTLAMGVNLPSSVVIIKDMLRYAEGYGMRPIPVLEYQQMAGRAGRPKYDKEGFAIAVARTENDIEHIFDNYINADTEKIFSKLALEPVLRMHLLSLIATGHIHTEGQLTRFMEKTFYAHQYSDLTELKAKMKRMLQLLSDYGLIEIDGAGGLNNGANGSQNQKPNQKNTLNALFMTADNFVKSSTLNSISSSNSGDKPKELKATPLGIRVAEMYIDPETANLIVESLKNAHSKKLNELSFLHLISNALELYPQLRVLKKDEDLIDGALTDFQDCFIVPEKLFDYESQASTVKTALMFNAWMNEKGEDALLEEYNIAPGELHVKRDTADWLLYAVDEIARIVGIAGMHKEISDLRIRLKHGVKRELLPLVALKGIGRMRARKLFNAGLKSAKDVRECEAGALEKIVGKKTAESLKANLCESL